MANISHQCTKIMNLNVKKIDQATKLPAFSMMESLGKQSKQVADALLKKAGLNGFGTGSTAKLVERIAERSGKSLEQIHVQGAEQALKNRAIGQSVDWQAHLNEVTHKPEAQFNSYAHAKGDALVGNKNKYLEEQAIRDIVKNTGTTNNITGQQVRQQMLNRMPNMFKGAGFGRFLLGKGEAVTKATEAFNTAHKQTLETLKNTYQSLHEAGNLNAASQTANTINEITSKSQEAINLNKAKRNVNIARGLVGIGAIGSIGAIKHNINNPKEEQNG